MRRHARLTLLPALLAAALALAAPPATAAAAPVRLDPLDPTTIILDAPITPAAADALAALLAATSAKTLRLDTTGGSLSAALAMADLVADHHLATLIPTDGLCFAECAIVFLAGAPRTANGPLALAPLTGLDRADAQLQLADLVTLFARTNTPPALLATLLRVPAGTHHYFTPAELTALGIAHPAPTVAWSDIAAAVAAIAATDAPAATVLAGAPCPADATAGCVVLTPALIAALCADPVVAGFVARGATVIRTYPDAGRAPIAPRPCPLDPAPATATPPPAPAAPPANPTAAPEPTPSTAIVAPVPDPAALPAVLYEENRGAPPAITAATVTWRIAAAPGARPILFAHLEVPTRGMVLELSFTATSQSPAYSHDIDVFVPSPRAFPGGGVADIPRLVAKPSETAPGTPLIGTRDALPPDYVWLGLAAASRAENLALLRDSTWFDLPILYADGQRAILSFPKGPAGTALFAQVLAEW